MSAFVELHPSWYPSKEEGPQEFKRLLEAGPGVERVEWQTAKASQGKVEHSYCKQNLLVYSLIARPGSASPPIEFVLTRYGHMKGPTCVKPTLTAMFKDPPVGLIGEAWRILLVATDGKQLLPGHVLDYWKKHVTRWEIDEPILDSAQSSPAPGEVPIPDTAQSLPALPLGSENAERKTAGQDLYNVLGAAAEVDPTPSVWPLDQKLNETADCTRHGKRGASSPRLATRQILRARQFSPAPGDAPVSDSVQSSPEIEGRDEEGDEKESNGEYEWEPLRFAPQISPRILDWEEACQLPDMRPRWASKEAFFEDLTANREERAQIIRKWEQLGPGEYMRIGEDAPYMHGTYVRTAVQGKKGNLKPGTCITGGMPPGGLFMTRNVDIASSYPMLLDWDEGEVPFPECFPVRMVLTLSCTEVRTVRRSRGPNHFWSKNYQSRGIIIRRAIRKPNKDKVMRRMHEVGYLKPTTAAALGERAGRYPSARFNAEPAEPQNLGSTSEDSASEEMSYSPQPIGSASDVGTVLENSSDENAVCQRRPL